MIEGVELTIYSATGENIAFDLSPTQLAVAAKILGLQIQEDGAIRCYSDDTLQQLATMRGNPLKLKEKEED